MQAITVPATSGALKLTEDQWKNFLSETLEDHSGDLETFGPWQIPVRFRAPAISIEWGQYGWANSYTLYGKRTLTELHQGGYELNGRVSIKGRKVRGFTSSLLVELPDGKLLQTAVIHCCNK